MTRVAGVVVLVLVSAWLGAVLLFGAVVAPAAFAALPTRALAGAVVGRILPVLFLTGMGVGAGLLLLAIRPWRPGLAAAGGVLVLACATSHFVIGARITRLRATIGSTLDALPAGDPQRALFGQLHAMSVAGLGLAVVAAMAAAWLASVALRRLPGPSALPG